MLTYIFPGFWKNVADSASVLAAHFISTPLMQVWWCNGSKFATSYEMCKSKIMSKFLSLHTSMRETTVTELTKLLNFWH